MANDKLILVKHAMPDINPLAPPRTWRLSDPGRNAARRLGIALIDDQPIAVLTSDEPKAIETGEIIAAQLQLQAIVKPGLREHERGVLPFESPSVFDEHIRKLFLHPDAVVYGCESADAAHRRFESATRSAISSQPPGTLVIVAHGTVIALLVGRANGLDPFPIWKSLGLPSFIVVERGSFTLIATE